MPRILESTCIYGDGNYNSFPSAARMPDGRLIVVFRQAEDSLKKYGEVTHVDPSSRIVAIVSDDDGSSWGQPREVYDDEMGEQDPCVTCLSDGSLVCTFFRWKVVPLEREAELGEAYRHYGRKIFGRWAAVHVGTACVRSTDCGETWEGPYHFPGGGFEGPLALRGNIVELPDGTILAPLYGAKRFGELSRCVVMGSRDKGLTWSKVGEVPGHPEKHFLEPFLHRAPSGRLDILMRTQVDWKGRPFDETYRPLHAASSADGGATWTEPAQTGLFCPNPIHLLPLGGGSALATYGQRRDPKGIQYLVVDQEKPRFEDALAAYARRSDDGDLGYTSAVRLGGGKVLVVYYLTDERSRACIGATTIGGFDHA